MPLAPGEYHVKLSDGSTMVLHGDPGLSDDQIGAFVTQHLKQAYPETNYQAGPVTHEKPTSFAQGVLEGVEKPINNAARALEAGADAIGVGGAIGRVGEALGMPGTVDQAVQAQQAQQAASPTQGSGFGRFVGETAGTLPTALIPGGVAAQGAAAGALLTNDRTLGGVAASAVEGALGGKFGDGLLRGGAALIAPNLRAPVKTLVDEGVQLTPGQLMGGTAKRVEDIAATIPVAGAMVSNAQRAGELSLNRAAINRTLTPIGQRLPRDLTGHEAVAYAGNQLSAEYGKVLPSLNGTLDNTFATRINAIRERVSVPPKYEEMLDQAQQELGNAFTRNGQNGEFSGRTLRDTSESLGDLASAWRKSDDPYIRRVGDATDAMRQQLHALARRQNPQQATALRNIDKGYASLVRVEKAASGTADGTFTPAQYDAGTRMSDQSIRRRQSARGQALDQDLSSSARQVMQNTAARGGSKDVISGGGLFALGLGAMHGNPAAIAGVGAIGTGTALYSPPVLAAIRALAARNPGQLSQGVAALLRQATVAAPGGASALLDQVGN